MGRRRRPRARCCRDGLDEAVARRPPRAGRRARARTRAWPLDAAEGRLVVGLDGARLQVEERPHDRGLARAAGAGGVADLVAALIAPKRSPLCWISASAGGCPCRRRARWASDQAYFATGSGAAGGGPASTAIKVAVLLRRYWLLIGCSIRALAPCRPGGMSSSGRVGTSSKSVPSPRGRGRYALVAEAARPTESARRRAASRVRVDGDLGGPAGPIPQQLALSPRALTARADRAAALRPRRRAERARVEPVAVPGALELGSRAGTACRNGSRNADGPVRI